MRTFNLIVMISILNVISLYGDQSCDQFINEHNRIKNDIQHQIILNSTNIIWPDCNSITENCILDSSLHPNQKSFARRWILNVNSCALDSLIYLRNMKNGDDWIISCSKKCGTYAQIIDGRTLSLLYCETVNLQDTINFEDNFVKLLKKYLNFKMFAYSKLKIRILERSKDYCSGEIFNQEGFGTDLESVDRNLFWIYKGYTIIDIVKSKNPFPYRGGISPGEYVIGSIARNDKRPFIRFGENVFDYKKEMYNRYKDYIDKIKGREIKRSDVYIYDTNSN